MRVAAVANKGAEENDQCADEQPRMACQQKNNAPRDKEGKQDKHQDGHRKFHRRAL